MWTRNRDRFNVYRMMTFVADISYSWSIRTSSNHSSLCIACYTCTFVTDEVRNLKCGIAYTWVALFHETERNRAIIVVKCVTKMYQIALGSLGDHSIDVGPVWPPGHPREIPGKGKPTGPLIPRPFSLVVITIGSPRRWLPIATRTGGWG